MMFRVICLSLALLLFSAQPSFSEDSFEARYRLALEHAKEWTELSEKGPDWVLRDTVLKGQLDALRAECGNVVDLKRREIVGILTD